jgi:hypothetical protein
MPASIQPGAVTHPWFSPCRVGRLIVFRYPFEAGEKIVQKFVPVMLALMVSDAVGAAV